MSKKVVVLGLGTFGQFLCRSLKRAGAEVVAVDTVKDGVESMKDVVDRVLHGDATDPAVLRRADVVDADAVIVAIGEHTEGSIITTLNLQELGVELIYARAVSDVHRKILEKLGVTRIINPESQSAERLAGELVQGGLESLATLEDAYQFVAINPPEPIQGKTLMELDLRRRFQVNVVGVRRLEFTTDEDGNEISRTRFVLPEASTVIGKNDRLLLIGTEYHIRNSPGGLVNHENSSPTDISASPGLGNTGNTAGLSRFVGNVHRDDRCVSRYPRFCRPVPKVTRRWCSSNCGNRRVSDLVVRCSDRAELPSGTGVGTYTRRFAPVIAD
jgi:trk system potassium uptake protein TrkA